MSAVDPDLREALRPVTEFFALGKRGAAPVAKQDGAAQASGHAPANGHAVNAQ